MDTRQGEDDRLVQSLTYRRMRLMPNSDVPSDAEFQNAKKCSSVKANAMCSDLENYYDSHFLILDIDFPVEILKSSSGNNHLIFGKVMSTEDMNKVLTVMAETGLLQKTWVDNAIANGYATLRAPGIKKHIDEDSRGLDANGQIETDEAFDAEKKKLRERKAKEYQSQNEEW